MLLGVILLATLRCAEQIGWNRSQTAAYPLGIGETLLTEGRRRLALSSVASSHFPWSLIGKFPTYFKFPRRIFWRGPAHRHSSANYDHEHCAFLIVPHIPRLSTPRIVITSLVISR